MQPPFFLFKIIFAGNWQLGPPAAKFGVVATLAAKLISKPFLGENGSSCAEDTQLGSWGAQPPSPSKNNFGKQMAAASVKVPKRRKPSMKSSIS